MLPYTGIYIHLPFCIQICSYCDFVKMERRQAGKVLFETYHQALLKELEQRLPASSGKFIRTLYFGGGTPSLTPVICLEKIIKKLQQKGVSFPLAEITLEVDPKTIRYHSLKQLHQLGVSRISLGAQTFQDELLQQLGRYHRVRDILQCFDDCRKAGFTNISLDWMMGIPGQNLEQCRKDSKVLSKLDPEHVSVYALHIARGTDFSRRRKSYAWPGDDLEIRCHRLALKSLLGLGLRQYEISNFAKPGQESLHNLACWNREPYLGLGAGASSFDGRRRLRNQQNIGGYIRKIKKGVSATTERHFLSARDDRVEYVMLQLRKNKGFSLDAYNHQFKSSLEADFPELFQNQTLDTLIKVRGNRIKLTSRGRFLSNEVFQALF